MDNSDRWVEKYGESFMDFPLKGLKFKRRLGRKRTIIPIAFFAEMK